jgi:hypothetical protein
LERNDENVVIKPFNMKIMYDQEIFYTTL